MRILLLLIVLLVCGMPVQAQKKELAQARQYIKKNQNLDKAEKSMRDLLKDSANISNTRVWQTLFDAVRAQYDQLNQKMYQKQNVDTALVMNTCRRLFLTAAEISAVHPDLGTRLSDDLTPLRPNLYSGGLYFIKKQNWGNAYDFLSDYLRYDSLNIDAAYMAIYSAYKSSKYAEVVIYTDLASQDSTRLFNVLEMVSDSYLSLGDSVNYEKTLRQGFVAGDRSDYFLSRLNNLYIGTGRLNEAADVIREAMKRDPDNARYSMYLCQLLYDMRQYDECMKWAERTFSLDDSLSWPYFNVGSIILMKADSMEKQKQTRELRRQMRNVYNEALPYFVKYRELEPEAADKWAKPLYRIYLYLNMGSEFVEMENIIKKEKL